MKVITTSLAILTIVASVAAQGAVVYSEFTDGELSGSGLNPTPITLALGSNEIRGSMGGNSSAADRDYFVVSVPTSLNLTALKVLPNTGIIGSVSFIGVQAGSQVTLDPRTASASGLLGWSHYGRADVGTDILPALSKGFGASGFTVPLGPGDYAFWLQETGSGSVTYGFDLQLETELQAVPLPGALVGFAAALGVLRTRRRSSLNGL